MTAACRVLKIYEIYRWGGGGGEGLLWGDEESLGRGVGSGDVRGHCLVACSSLGNYLSKYCKITYFRWDFISRFCHIVSFATV
jgi:hypothetical protein